MTGGMAPRSASSSAVRTLMELTMAMAAIVEPGPDRGVEAVDRDERVGVRGAQVDHEVGLVHEPAADGRVGRRPTSTARRRLPRRRAARAGGRRGPSRPGRRSGRRPRRRSCTSCGPNVKFDEDDLGQAGRPLDEHRLALAVGADDLGVERHRQLDHRVEARDTSRSAGTAPRPGSASGRSRRGGRARPRRSCRRPLAGLLDRARPGSSARRVEQRASPRPASRAPGGVVGVAVIGPPAGDGSRRPAPSGRCRIER